MWTVEPASHRGSSLFLVLLPVMRLLPVINLTQCTFSLSPILDPYGRVQCERAAVLRVDLAQVTADLMTSGR